MALNPTYETAANIALYGTKLNHKTGADLATVGTVTLGSDADGDYLEVTSQPGNRLSAGNVPYAAKATGATWVFQFKTATTAIASIGGTLDTGTSYLESLVFNQQNNTNTTTLNGAVGLTLRASGDSSPLYVRTGGISVNDGNIHCVAIKRIAATGVVQISVDGVTQSVTQYAASADQAAGTTEFPLTLFERNVRNSSYDQSLVAKLYCYARLDGDGFDIDALSADPSIMFSSSTDTTAPSLTSATGSATGATSGSGSVTTDEGTGTLYYLVSTAATETATTVKAASSQAVSATGSQAVSFTGLTASTTYYAHYLHRDAAGNDSAVASSASFTTAAPAGDETAPTLTGSITISALTTTSYTATWPAGSDNVAVTGYEYQIDAGGWTSVGTSLTVNISGRTPSTTESFQVRAFDAAGNRSTALTQSVTLATPVAGVTITEPLKNNTGAPRANESGVGVALLQTGDFTYGLTTDAAGLLETVTGATAGQSYYVVIKTADGGVGITGPITAS